MQGFFVPRRTSQLPHFFPIFIKRLLKDIIFGIFRYTDYMGHYRQSEEYNQHVAKNGLLVERIGNVIVLIRQIPLLGSIIKIQRCPTEVPFTEIKRLAKSFHALFVIIDSDTKTEETGRAKLEQDFKTNGYKNLGFNISPTKTAIIDLTRSEESLLASFDSDIRQHIKRNKRQEISIRVTESFEELYALLREAGQRRQFFVQETEEWKSQWGSFGKQAKIILAYQNGEIIGGNMFLAKPPLAFGLFLPTTEEGKRVHIAPTLIWEGFKLAKMAGCTSFDLDGIYDSRYNAPKKWLGLTAFKRKFHGHEVEYIHAKIKIYAWYIRPFGWLGLL